MPHHAEHPPPQPAAPTAPSTNHPRPAAPIAPSTNHPRPAPQLHLQLRQGDGLRARRMLKQNLADAVGTAAPLVGGPGKAQVGADLRQGKGKQRPGYSQTGSVPFLTARTVGSRPPESSQQPSWHTRHAAQRRASPAAHPGS